MSSLESALRRTLQDEGVARIPSADVDAAWNQLITRRGHAHRPNRRQWAAGLGVTMTALAVAVGLLAVAPSSRSPKPESATAAPLGPIVRSLSVLPARGDEGTRWGAVSFSDAAHGWATGADCGLGGGGCHPLLAVTADAGRTWQPVTSPLTSGSVGYGGTPHAVGGGVYLTTFDDSSARFTHDGGRTWTTIVFDSQRFAGSVAATVVGSDLVVIDQTVSTTTSSVGQTCVDSEITTTIRAGRIVSVTRIASGPETQLALAPDGSRWQTATTATCTTHGTQSPAPGAVGVSSVRVAAPASGYGPAYALPAATNALVPVDRRNAWFVGWDSKIWVTHDSGRTWQDAGFAAHSQLLVPTDATHAVVETELIGMSESLTPWRSIGQRAMPPTLTVPVGRGNGIDVLTADHGVLSLIDEGGRYLTSRDSGRTWHLQGQLPS